MVDLVYAESSMCHYCGRNAVVGEVEHKHLQSVACYYCKYMVWEFTEKIWLETGWTNDLSLYDDQVREEAETLWRERGGYGSEFGYPTIEVFVRPDGIEYGDRWPADVAAD
jgi:hypothetical protein